jgi:hypothetical protein
MASHFVIGEIEGIDSIEDEVGASSFFVINFIYHSIGNLYYPKEVSSCRIAPTK